MTDQTLFNESLDLDNLPEPIDPNKDYLTELVGDDKKFKTAAELARGKAESDAFIARIQRENSEMRQRLKEATTMQSLIDKINNPSIPNTPQPSANQPEVNGNVTSVTEETIEQIINDRLAQRDQTSRESQNIQWTLDRLKATWGDNYESKLKAKAKELGVGQQFLDSLAKNQPNAFLKLVDIDTGQRTRTPDFVAPAPQPTRTGNYSPNVKNMAYFRNIKSTQGDHVYFSPKVQNEMFTELAAQGDDFYK